jgi:hypothetical protein
MATHGQAVAEIAADKIYAITVPEKNMFFVGAL